MYCIFFLYEVYWYYKTPKYISVLILQFKYLVTSPTLFTRNLLNIWLWKYIKGNIKFPVLSFLYDRCPLCCLARPRHGSKTIALINVARVFTAPTHKVGQLDDARRELIKERAHFSAPVSPLPRVASFAFSVAACHEKFDVTRDCLARNCLLYLFHVIRDEKWKRSEKNRNALEIWQCNKI